MDTVASADGTPIAFDRLGDGPPVVLVTGALCDRRTAQPLAEHLADRFTVLTYDRRGRGDSGDRPHYAVTREVEDLTAVAATVGRRVAVYGHSAGAALVVHAAAAAGTVFAKVVLHDTPYAPDRPDRRRAGDDYTRDLTALLTAGRRGDAVALFHSLVGIPTAVVRGWRQQPWWAGMEALAPTLAYDAAVLAAAHGDVPVELLRRVTAPTLVITGGAGRPGAADLGEAIADALPHARHTVLPGQAHVVPADILAPVLTTFLSES